MPSVRKHRAPKGALRQAAERVGHWPLQGQKAPSAKRCIKTGGGHGVWAGILGVRKHRAPKGALRHTDHWHHERAAWSESTERQKVH